MEDEAVDLEQRSLAEWFVAALLHDIGKLQLGEHGGWGGHERLEGRLRAALDEPYPSLIAEHHSSIRSGKPRRRVLALADRTQKSIQSEGVPLELDLRYQEELRAAWPPWGLPYYGEPERWSPERALQLRERVARTLRAEQPAGVGTALRANEQLSSYPQANYLPHLSLALHNRLTGALFALIWRFLEAHRFRDNPIAFLSDFREQFELSLAVLTPEPPEAVDGAAAGQGAHALAEGLRRYLFETLSGELPEGISPTLSLDAHPFELYRGDAVAWVWDDADRVLGAAERFLERDASCSDGTIIRADVTRLSRINPRGGPGARASARHMHVRLPREMSGRRGSSASSDGSALGLREAEVHDVPAGGQIARVLVELPGDLRSAALDTGARLLDKYKRLCSADADSDVNLSGVPLSTTPYGLFEHLQALDAVAQFQADLRAAVDEVNEGAGETVAAVALAQPTRTVVVAREAAYRGGLAETLRELRRSLQLPTSERVLFSGEGPPPRSPLPGTPGQ
ncbi:MAG: hypothetical protein U9R79_17420 [Armatimonadota bacterium]|nr:hypothetical protein [Armatimonadota bacterium]